ncbi:MAG: MFS transporter [Coriobacteriia bacterium]|nr:MFS transporter [Coriobacteriia bacterium]
MRAWTHSTFVSLGVRNYRLFFAGQAISLSGTWMQAIAMSWLVLKLTNSGSALGLVTALQCLPIFILAPYGGVLADRFPKRKLLFVTQSCAAVLALALGALVAADMIRLWMVFVFALLLGCVNAVDNPTRQTFVHELVGAVTLRNAVTLNSLEVNLCRVIGPAIAGVLIASVGLASCFVLNGLSFIAALWSLWRMTGSELHRSALVKAAKGQIREGLIYARRTPLIFGVLMMMAIMGTLTYEFQVSLPLLAKFTFLGDASSYAALTSAMGVGAVIGGLSTAGRRSASAGALMLATLGFGVAMVALSLSPTITVAMLCMVVVGVCSITFMSLCNTILQLESTATMRGRVMSLWSVAFLGSTLIGAPVIGWIGEHLGPRWSIATGALAALAAATVGFYALRSVRRVDLPEVEIEAPLITEKEDMA